MSEQSPEAEYAGLADQLDAIQKSESRDGQGAEHIRWIVDDLRQGDIEAARTNYRNQSDKYDWFPQTKQFLKDIGVIEGK